MISKNDVIDSNVMKLQSDARPPLAGGEYELVAKVALGAAGKSFDDNKPLHITVEAPRFGIDLSSIYSVYPLGGSIGAYQDNLPHIVFTSKTLPWERKIDSEGLNPWVSLLLLTEEEINANDVKIQTLKIEDIVSGPNDLLVPDVKIEAWEKKLGQANVLEMPLDLFKAIAPLPTDELPYLAHARQVDVLDKENLEANPKGWFAVVIGNRLAQAEKTNRVFLVSMEGLKPAYTDTTHQRLRMILLAQWSFQCQGHTFTELVEKLSENIKPFRMEAMDVNKQETTNADILKALQYGYCPINHQWRNGQKTVSWYRGPLVPVDIPPPDKYQYDNADQALRFDESTGMFDISYAAAWQLGRLLALQNVAFSKALNDWKADYKRERPLAIAQDILEKLTDHPIGKEELPKKAHMAESDAILTDLLIELWHE